MVSRNFEFIRIYLFFVFFSSLIFDKQPETIPQASIDMTKVLEVATAEDVTGHSNSLAITAPERVTFVKGTCPEETKWWLNILSAFPKSKVSNFATIRSINIPSFLRKLLKTVMPSVEYTSIPSPSVKDNNEFGQQSAYK